MSEPNGKTFFQHAEDREKSTKQEGIYSPVDWAIECEESTAPLKGLLTDAACTGVESVQKGQDDGWESSSRDDDW